MLYDSGLEPLISILGNFFWHNRTHVHDVSNLPLCQSWCEITLPLVIAAAKRQGSLYYATALNTASTWNSNCAQTVGGFPVHSDGGDDQGRNA
jgi:hypothetical protein